MLQEEQDALLIKNVEIIKTQCSQVFNCAIEIVDRNYCYFCFQNL